MTNRLQEINNALEKLNAFKEDAAYSDRFYAIDENIRFLNAIKTVPSYVAWLFGRAGKIDGSRLLELTDFPIPEWDIKMHERLIEIQRRDKPGLIKPLINALVEFIKDQQGSVTLADLGAGGMEIERQLVVRLLAINYTGKLCIVGIDKSPTTHLIAKKNLAEIADRVEIVERETLNERELENIKVAARKNIIIVLCKNDIFELNTKFSDGYFDAVYHSLFKHHLFTEQQIALKKVSQHISKEVFEFDGFRSFIPHLFIQSLIAWKYPIFLGGTVFSMLRYIKKEQIPKSAKLFMNTAHYLFQS